MRMVFGAARSENSPTMRPGAPAESVPRRIGWAEGHLPDLVDPLDPSHPVGP